MIRMQVEGDSRNKRNTKVWKIIWNLNMKHKLKHFIWKCLHRILPVNEVIKSRIGKGEDKCLCYGEGTETLEHMLFFCQQATMIWKDAPVRWDGMEHFRPNFWLWWNSLMDAQQRKDRREHIVLTVNILWQVWKARNKVQFNREKKCPRMIINQAVQEWQEYELANQKIRGAEQETGPQSQDRWTPPIGGVVMLNTDAATDIKHGKASWGFIARRGDGDIVGAWAGIEKKM